MSKQSFSTQVRNAIWKAHGSKCLYCTEPVRFINLIIDHVIPEVTTADELRATIARVGLHVDFNILHWENHAPCCYECNKNKLAYPLHDGVLSITLKRIEAKLPKVRELIRKAKGDDDLDKILRTVLLGLDSGSYTHEDLVNGLELMRRFPNGITGAKPSTTPRPPASPEEGIMGIKFSARPVTIKMSTAVRRRLERLNITSAQLAHRIETSAMAGRFNIQALPKVTIGHFQQYLIRMDQGTRLRVEISDDVLDIKEVSNYHD